MHQIGTESSLTPRQLRALECLLAQEPGENLEDIARRAGVSRTTLWRYLRDADFNREFKARVRAHFKQHSLQVAQALIQGALAVGPGQPAMQRLYWQLIGELNDRLELTGKDGGPVEMTPIPLDSLSTEAKRGIIAILEREQALDDRLSGL